MSGDIKKIIISFLNEFKDALCPVRMTLAQWFTGEKDFYKILLMYFRYIVFCHYLTLEKGALHLNKPESLSHKNTVPYLDEIGTLVLEKIFKILSMFYFWLFF